MCAAILEVCIQNRSDGTESMPALAFPHDALQHVLFTLKSDTSVRIRRLGIEVLQTAMASSLGHLTLTFTSLLAVLLQVSVHLK